MSSSDSRNRSDRTGDALVRIGGIVFILGAVATVATVAPLFLGTSRLPTPAYAACMLMPLGFLLALVGMVRAAMSQRRAASAPSPSSPASSDAAPSDPSSAAAKV